MHIWDDKQSSTTHHKMSTKKMDYSHCPLKKRPVHFVKNIKEEMDFGNYRFGLSIGCTYKYRKPNTRLVFFFAK